MQDPFILPREQYTRDLNIVKHYQQTEARFLSIMTGDPLEKTLAFMEREMKPGGCLGIHNPTVEYLARIDPLTGEQFVDRQECTGTFMDYIRTIHRHNLIVAPTFTAYIPKDQDPSILAVYTQDRKDTRKRLKKEMFVAEREGNKVLEGIRKAQQNAAKIDGNSISGTFNSNGTVLFNRSSHSTLTSACRIATAYGNANNEKFLMGNRHYWKPEVAVINIVATIQQADLGQIESACQQFNIAYPTPEEVLACVLHAMALYGTNNAVETFILELATKMSPVERAAVVYCGDMYHLALLNETQVRTFIADFITPPEVCLTLAEIEAYYGPPSQLRIEGNIRVFGMMSYMSMLKGVKDLETLYSENPDGYRQVLSHMHHIEQMIQKYSPLIRAFWTTHVLPGSIASMPSMLRSTVIGGDTDSTIYSVDYWVAWYLGEITFTDEAYRIGALMVFLTSKTIIHLLAKYSAVAGVANEEIHEISMKNEYYFPVFVSTSRSKHYFAYQGVREGNIYKTPKLELKGAELRNANTPNKIKTMEMELIHEIMDQVMQTGKVDVEKHIRFIAAIEHCIRRDIEEGGFRFFRLGNIKGKETYTTPDKSAYQYYEMWNHVFGDKYGMAQEPPYRIIDFKVALKNKTEIKAWLDDFSDPVIRSKMEQWMMINNKTRLTALLLPLDVISVCHIPVELISGANYAKAIYSIMSPFYIILETLSFFYATKPKIELISDQIDRALLTDEMAEVYRRVDEG